MKPQDVLADPAHGIVQEARPLQVALAEYLHQAIQTRAACVCEAGTGIGKSFAYLLNAIEATKHGHRVVISTAMKSLQQQLFFKDLPYLTSKGYKVRYARVLGKSNYACRRQVDLNVFDQRELADYEEFFDSVMHWVWEDAPEDLSSRLPKNRYEYSVAYCSKTNCDFYEQCSEKGYLAAKTDAESAQILVVNHALIGADIRVWDQHAKKMLGDYTTLIVDEAHKYPEAIRNAIACEMPHRFFEKASDKFGNLAGNLDADITALMNSAVTDVIPRSLPMLRELELKYRAMFNETQRTGGFGNTAKDFAATCRKCLDVLAQECDVGTPAYQDFLLNTQEGIMTRKLKPALRQSEPAMQALYFLNEYSSKLHGFANAIDLATQHHISYVVSIDTDQRGNSTIKTIPVQVDERLLRYYEARKIVPAYLSATLTVNRSFEYFAREVGIDVHAEPGTYLDDDGRTWQQPGPTFHAGTPFNLAKQAWCYLPDSIPEPNAGDAYIHAVVDECFDLLLANEGHAFILFTSYKDMDAVAEGLRERGYPYPLLVQSSVLKARGREIFMNTPNATLLGTRTFWEGIDIPGMKLTLVIIPKAPFPNPGDAIVKAKTALAGDKWFHQVYMPMMLTDLRQMAGRLIRSTSDRGIVAMLDRRVHTKSYGKQLVDAVGFPWGSSKATAVKLLGQLSTIRRRQT